MSIPFSQCLPNSSNGIIGTNFARASTSSLSVASCEFSENFNLLCEGSNLCLKNLGEVRSVIYVPRPRHAHATLLELFPVKKLKFSNAL